MKAFSAAAEEVLAPLKVPKGMGSDEFTRRLLENLIPYRIAYLRDEPTLKEALAKVQRLRQETLQKVIARDPHELVKANEMRSMVWVAEMILQSVLFRQESRGFVYREDYPNTDNVNWLKWVMICKEESGVKVWGEGFPTPYIQPPVGIYPAFGGDV